MKNNIKRSKVNKSNLIQPLKYFKAKVKAMDSNYLNEYNDVVIVNTAVISWFLMIQSGHPFT